MASPSSSKEDTSAEAHRAEHEDKPSGVAKLALGSLGVVFGDIGTSPLYAFREATAAAVGEEGFATRPVVLGILSLIIWAIIIIVTAKYVMILLRADNNGEGGTLSLMALAQRGFKKRSRWLIVLGIIGASLFYADATITPAISVLAAVEGLTVKAPRFGAFVVPLTLLILVILFSIQRKGTGSVANLFGPITALWFVTMGIAGFMGMLRDPSVVFALSPHYAIGFLIEHQFVGFVTLGAVFLAVPGTEALYADLGHFGRRPMMIAWFSVVMPSLLLNYFGQAALILSDPAAMENPFYLLYPEWLLLPVVVLATAATVIASQAVITGAYSLGRQAIQLGLFPRMRILFTSETTTGQIYIPRINWLLFAAVVVVTILFGSSSRLAGAYGISVSAALVVDSLLAIVVMRFC